LHYSILLSVSKHDPAIRSGEFVHIDIRAKRTF
jgi:hypothetical protein